MRQQVKCLEKASASTGILLQVANALNLPETAITGRPECHCPVCCLVVCLQPECALTLDDLWGSELWRAALQGQLGLERGGDASQTKISNLQVALVIHEDVLWLQVAMDHLPAA